MDTVPLDQQDEARLHQLFESIPAIKMFGLELVHIELGLAVVRLTIRAEMLQNRGVLHGGVTAALVDSATSFAVASYLQEGESTATIDLTVHYLRPLATGHAKATARVLRAGRQIFSVSADVVDQENRPAAHALSTYMRLPVLQPDA
jgi:uncharacterized protein (TIGR00369 family)